MHEKKHWGTREFSLPGWGAAAFDTSLYQHNGSGGDIDSAHTAWGWAVHALALAQKGVTWGLQGEAGVWIVYLESITIATDCITNCKANSFAHNAKMSMLKPVKSYSCRSRDAVSILFFHFFNLRNEKLYFSRFELWHKGITLRLMWQPSPNLHMIPIIRMSDEDNVV